MPLVDEDLDPAIGVELEEKELIEKPKPLATSTANSTAPGISIDEFLEIAGGWGRFQSWLLAMLAFTYGGIACVMMEPQFLTPLAEETIGLTESQARTVTSAFFVGFFMGLHLWGVLGDKYGRRPVQLATLFFTCVTAGLAPLSTGFTSFLVMRRAHFPSSQV